MRYPPLGQRSFGPTRAAISNPSYGVDANDEVLAFAMIETANGMKNLESIVATPGLDGIYVGPADLTLGTQEGRLAPGLDRMEDEMITLIKRVASVCNKHKIIAGIHCGTAEYAAKAIGWGYNLTTIGGDTKLLANAASASVSAWRNLTGREENVKVTGGVY
jgi:4-hydroxy-2-oxoheptanedioate aldolase